MTRPADEQPGIHHGPLDCCNGHYNHKTWCRYAGERGLRATVSELIYHVDDYGFPFDPIERATWIDAWCGRILRATGFYKLQEKHKDDLK